MRLMTGTATALALVTIAGTGTALAHPGQGGAHPGDRGSGHGAQVAPGKPATAPCVKTRDVVVSYVFRGTVAGAETNSVTVNLSAANAHAKRALAAATPGPVAISTGTTDLLRVDTTGAKVTRNGVAGAPKVGDRVTVQYRAPHSKNVGKRCVAGGTAAVTVTDGVATFAGTGVQLKRVTASGA